MEGTRGIAEPAVLRDLMYRGPVFRTGGAEAEPISETDRARSEIIRV